MEGYGFLQAALSFANAEQCALLKVVSDGPAEHAGGQQLRIDAKTARRLVQDRLDLILAQVERLQNYSACLNERSEDPPYFRELVQGHRFSEAQRHRLRKLLQRWAARFPDRALELGFARASTEQFLDAIDAELSSHQRY